MRILAIDPGNVKSAYVIIDFDTCKPLQFNKTDNESLLYTLLIYSLLDEECRVVIEKIASYGMPVGEEVFDTCIWTGRFMQTLDERNIPTELVKRYEVKINLCHDTRAKDANIIQALVDRFTPGARNYGKGTKQAPGWFYGFKADIWQAYALGVTYIDRLKGGEQ